MHDNSNECFLEISFLSFFFFSYFQSKIDHLCKNRKGKTIMGCMNRESKDEWIMFTYSIEKLFEVN